MFKLLLGSVLLTFIQACAFSSKEKAQELLKQSTQDLPAIIDTHMHLVCREAKNGCYVSPSLFSPLTHPYLTFKAQFLMEALGAKNHEKPDDEIRERLKTLVQNFPGEKPYFGLVLAFTASYDATTNSKDLTHTGLEVPNEYMQNVVQDLPSKLIPVFSLHPFQKTPAMEARPRIYKILPNSMNFSPGDERCLEFFSKIASSGSLLIAHVGDEHSVEGGGINNAYGNPMLYEKWLTRFPNLSIVFAHAGAAGKSSWPDESKEEENFKLVLNLLRKFPKQTYADISGFSLAPTRTRYLQQLLAAKDLHPQLLYGSDYPLPSIRALLKSTLWAMYFNDLLGDWSEFQAYYQAILTLHDTNPLAASFVTMRVISYNGNKFDAGVFFNNAQKILAKTAAAPDLSRLGSSP